jgi:hypothetical protein
MRKKIILAGIALIGIATGLVYWLIPGTLTIQKELIIVANINPAREYYFTTAKMMAWWPGKMETDSTLLYNGYHFRISRRYEDGADIQVGRPGQAPINTQLSVIASGRKNILLNWKCESSSGNNPISRILNRSGAVALKKTMDSIAGRFQAFLENTENTYGITVAEGKFTDSVLITRNWQSRDLPTTPQIYAAITTLRQQAARHSASATNAPMLHIYRDKKDPLITVIVALPINREIPVDKGMEIKRLFTGNMLVSEVKGGYARLFEAEQQLGKYRLDYQYTSPAIPFQSLVTDRMAEADTNKWVTKLYYPVF